MANDDAKPTCKYGKDCYRKNPDHLSQFSHPEGSVGTSPTKSPGSTSQKREADASNGTNGEKRPREDSPYPDDHRIHLYDPREEAAAAALKIQLAELVKDRPRFLRQMFYAIFQQEFYDFWEFCKTINADHPEKAFEQFGLKLVGPFDVLAGKFDNSPLYEPIEYLTHWRFFYDVPEFQTVLVKDQTEIHYGYWKDIPLEGDLSPTNNLIARNDAAKGCEMKMVAANMFQAVMYFLENDFSATPFNKAAANKMKKALEDFANAKDIDLTNAEELIKEREAKIVCRSLHRVGIVAPLDRRTKVGYRPLQVSDANLKKILEKFENIKIEDKDAFTQAMEGLHPVITAADIAVDEKDSATALELGIDLFCSGYEVFHELCKLQLITGYNALNRPQYIAIAKTHLANRRKGNKLDLLSRQES